MNKFQQGDKVQYCGERVKELSGKLGVVHARVQNTETGVVVDFGNDCYILDEQRHLTRFQGKEGLPHSHEDDGKNDKKPAGPEIVRRKSRKVPAGE